MGIDNNNGTLEALMRSLLYAVSKGIDPKASPIMFACCTPRSFSGVSIWPWIMPSLFASVSPCRTR